MTYLLSKAPVFYAVSPSFPLPCLVFLLPELLCLLCSENKPPLLCQDRRWRDVGCTRWARPGSLSVSCTDFQPVLLFSSLTLTLAFGGSCCHQVLSFWSGLLPQAERCESSSLLDVHTAPSGLQTSRHKCISVGKDIVGSLLNTCSTAVRRFYDISIPRSPLLAPLYTLTQDNWVWTDL